MNARYDRRPGFYADRYAYTRCRFVFGGKGWVNPVKEITAAKLRLEMALSTLEQECASRAWIGKRCCTSSALKPSAVPSWACKRPRRRHGWSAPDAPRYAPPRRSRQQRAPRQRCRHEGPSMSSRSYPRLGRPLAEHAAAAAPAKAGRHHRWSRWPPAGCGGLYRWMPQS